MRQRFVPLILFLSIAIVLVLIVDDFVQRVIIAPLLGAAWFFTVVLTSLPQFVFWGLFIVVALVIAGKSVGREETSRQQFERAPTSRHGPVATWSSLLERAKKQDFSRWRLAQAMRKLSWDIHYPDEPVNQHQVDSNRKGSISTLPPDIDAFFDAPMPSYQRFSRFRHLRRAESSSAALDLDPERVVEYLEYELDPLLGENQ